MHHNYAFLWVLLLVQGNEIRFYRGKIQRKSELSKKIIIFLDVMNSKLYSTLTNDIPHPSKVQIKIANLDKGQIQLYQRVFDDVPR